MQATWNERYERFFELMGQQENLVPNGLVLPRWIGTSTRFWYERIGESGPVYRVVDAQEGETLCDILVSAVVDALANSFAVSFSREETLLMNVQFDEALEHMYFEAYQASWYYHLAQGWVAPTAKRTDANWLASPDGSAAVLVRNHDLVLRILAVDEEQHLTSGGEHAFAYASGPASTRTKIRAAMGEKPHGIWSPDSRWFFTLQTDDRHVGAMPIIDFLAGSRPSVNHNYTSLPMDESVTGFHMLAIDTISGRQVRAKHPPLPAVRMNGTPFSAGLAWWSADSRTAYFVDIARGEKRAAIIAFDVATGDTRTVFTEEADHALELSVTVYAAALVFPLPESAELVWYSERSGHGHLYLIDLNTGAIKRQLTEGAWQVRELLGVDPLRREVFFLAGGLDPEGDPYLRRPCTVSLDSGAVRILSDLPGDHIVWRANEFGLLGLAFHGADPSAVSGLSPDGSYFVETVGTVDSVPTTFLRRRDGSLVRSLESGRSDRLPDGWCWPRAVQTVAADGITRIYGLLFSPWCPDPGRKAPLIDFIYGGPQVSFVPKNAGAEPMAARTYAEAAALASLGCYVLLLDGRGTAWRERAFRHASYRAVQTASSLEDHIAAIEQLAARNGDIDMERIGITGFSGGGYMSALAALRHGEFFKVTVAGGGNYDQAAFWHCWGERYHGLFDEDHYRAQAAKHYAAGLQGKLLLVHGLLDSGCHPGPLFQLVQALIDENKDFDLVVIPKAAHEWTGYGQRRRIDYFVQHLFGAVPPPARRFLETTEIAIARLAANSRALPIVEQMPHPIGAC